MNEKLKPCPICGGDAKVVSYYIKGTANRLNYFVQCEENKCHRTRSRRKKVNAIADWENEIFDRQHEEWIRRKQVSVPTEEVYNVYYDTAGNCHFTGTKSGEHIIPANTEAVRHRIGEVITTLDDTRQTCENITIARRKEFGEDDIMAEYRSGMAAAFDLAIIYLERALTEGGNDE